MILELEILQKILDLKILNLFGLKIGKVYEIDINLAGREWKDRHFISLKAWRVKEVEAEAATEGDGNMPF